MIYQCLGCNFYTLSVFDADECSKYRNPLTQWTRIGGCAIRSHNRGGAVDDDFKLNPLKASKRSRRIN